MIVRDRRSTLFRRCVMLVPRDCRLHKHMAVLGSMDFDQSRLVLSWSMRQDGSFLFDEPYTLFSPRPSVNYYFPAPSCATKHGTEYWSKSLGLATFQRSRCEDQEREI